MGWFHVLAAVMLCWERELCFAFFIQPSADWRNRRYLGTLGIIEGDGWSRLWSARYCWDGSRNGLVRIDNDQGCVGCVSLWRRRRRRWAQRVSLAAVTETAGLHEEGDGDVDMTHNVAVEEKGATQQAVLTSAVLKVAYQGYRFHGWSYGNDDPYDSSDDNGSGEELREDDEIDQDDSTWSRNGDDDDYTNLLLSSRRRRGRGRRRGMSKHAKVRSVAGVLRQSLAKLYGAIEPNRVVLDSCSRTDRGVHAECLLCQFYAAVASATDTDNKQVTQQDPDAASDRGSSCSSASRPRSPHDEDYLPVPFHWNVQKVMYCLNRMLPADIRILDIAPTPPPHKSSSSSSAGVLPFHPALDTVRKTYQYTFSVGPLHDPLRCRQVWHSYCPTTACFDLDAARAAAAVMIGRHDFVAFRGAFRGSERGRVQHTLCTLFDLDIQKEQPTSSCRHHIADGLLTPTPTQPTDGTRIAPRSRRRCAGEEQQTETGMDGAQLDGTYVGGPPSDAMATYVVFITGDRFLYKMVRFIVAAIVTVGLDSENRDQRIAEINHSLATGTRLWEPTANKNSSLPTKSPNADEMKNNASSSERSTVKPPRRFAAPPHALTLRDVQYKESVDFQWIHSPPDQQLEFAQRKTPRHHDGYSTDDR